MKVLILCYFVVFICFRHCATSAVDWAELVLSPQYSYKCGNVFLSNAWDQMQCYFLISTANNEVWLFKCLEKSSSQLFFEPRTSLCMRRQETHQCTWHITSTRSHLYKHNLSQSQLLFLVPGSCPPYFPWIVQIALSRLLIWKQQKPSPSN